MRHTFIFLLLACSLVSAAITREEALDFLYSTMSLPDSADYSAKFYEDNVDASLRARRKCPGEMQFPTGNFCIL